MAKRVCIKMYTLFVFIFSISITYGFQDGTTFSTPNYPQPYTGQLSQRQTITVNSTQGVAVVFEQFLASARDCVIACPTDNDGDCYSLCGDAMDHGLVPKLLRVPGNTIVTVVSTEPNDGFPHSGISGKIFKYDLKTLSFFNCNEQVDLSSGDTYYLISQNYPLSPTFPFSQCSIKFSTSGTRQGIRFAVYDFYLNDLFEITGQNGGDVKIKGFATEDEPVVYYFQNEANVTFSIPLQTHSFVQKRFYILVKSYEISTTTNNCINIGNTNLAIGQSHNFGTRQFGAKSYEDNLNCQYKFTRTPGTNSLFALGIEYESEKCCDTMTINGLSQYEEIYQGFQYSNLFFSNSTEMNFNFQSDGVVGGTGLNATVQHIDCTCPSSMLLVKNDVLTSPGYSTSLSYCPNLMCNTKLEFQDDLYDLQMEFLDVSLRTYSQTNDTDSLTVFDSYEHPVVAMKPNYGGFNKFWATVSPVTIQLMSQSLTYFPLNMIGRGFLMNLNLMKKQYITEKVIFDDGLIFKDISNIPLATGNTFEYIVNGRTGHQIHLYFFTKTSNQVFIDIFDGDSMDAPKIDNKALYSSVLENGPSFTLSTSGEKAIVHIRSDPTFLQPGTDFQMLITDVKINDNCGPLTFSLRTAKTKFDVPLQGTDCYKVIHFADGGYSQSAFMNIEFSQPTTIQMFYGLSISPNNIIANSSSDPIPQDLFTNYLVLKYSILQSVTSTYSWDISSGLIARTMTANDTVIFMSDDFGKSNTTSTIQQFSVQLEGESNVQTGMTCEFLSDSGNGAGTLTWSDYDGEIKKQSYSSAPKSLKYSSCGNKIFVDYTSPGGGPYNGLHLKITRADLRCSLSPSYLTAAVVLLFVSVISLVF